MYIDQIFKKVLEGDTENISEKDVSIAILYELRALNDKSEALNEKVDGLESKMEKSVMDGLILHKQLDERMEKKFSDMATRLTTLENAHVENATIKKMPNWILTGFVLLTAAWDIYLRLKGAK